MTETSSTGSPLTLHCEHLSAIAPETVYRILKLRQDVFSIDQQATDADIDGRELEPGTLMLWGEDATGQVVGHARILVDTHATHIGRMVVDSSHRHAGYGRRVMLAAVREALTRAPGLPLEISAQAYLEAWYQSMGFVTIGEAYMEAGIRHVPMRWEGETPASL